MFNFFKKNNKTPDFSEIDSQEKAIEFYEKGYLTKMYLFPIEFGGSDDIRNIVYVPKFAAELKQRFDAMLPDLIDKGLVNNYSASPEYKGNSFVPSKVKLKASGKSGFEETINIW